MATLLARNAQVLVTMDGHRREIAGGGLFARDGIIEAVGASDALPATADRILDLAGHVVLPGLVNAHHHLDQTLTRALPAAQNINLFRWLKAHYRLWAARTPEASRTATLVGLAELALSGCTTCFDHAYVFRNGCRVDDQIGAARDIGMRFVVSRGSMSLGESRGGLPPDACVEDEDDILADCERVIDRYHDPRPGSMLQIALAPCSPFSVSPELMKASAALARKRGVRLHTHLAETIDEERFTLARFGKRPVAYMDELGWLDGDVWFAHAVHINDHEIGCFADAGVGVCHCPCSNMRLASGIAPVQAYRAAGVKVGLGVDGSASNDGNHLLGEARQAMLLARLKMALRPPEGPDTTLSTSDPSRDGEWLQAREALELATLGSASVLGRDDIGSLEPGKCADFCAIRLDNVGYAGALADPVAATLFCAPRTVDWTVVAGVPVVERGALVTIDLPSVVAEHNHHAARLAALSEASR